MIPLWERLDNAGKPIVLYGIGNGADKILDFLEGRGTACSGVFASDGFAQGKSYRGFTVLSYDEAKRRFGEMIVLLAFGTHRPEVIANIKRIASEQDLYAPPFPVVGGTPSGGFAAERGMKAERLRAYLADEKSRAVFDGVLAYRMDGRLDHLFPCESGADEIWELLSPSADDDYLDLGAYRGDTVAEFAARTKTWRSIRAVEPDARSFSKLRAYCAGLDGCRCFNACIGREAGEESFFGGMGRGSLVSSGGVKTRRESVDSLLLGKRASLIKIDVEGAETEAVEGARDTIKKYAPKLLISAYHRADDIFDIPDAVLLIRPDYRVFLRHGRCVPDWDTEYIFLP